MGLSICDVHGDLFCHFRCPRPPLVFSWCSVRAAPFVGVLDALCAEMDPTSSYSPTILTPDTFFSLYIFAFSKMLLRCIQTVCSLFHLA